MYADTETDSITVLRNHSSDLWILSLLFFGVGDLVTTFIGFNLGGVVEVAPLASMALAYGFAPLFLFKGLALGLCVGLWVLSPKPHRLGVPLGLAVLGILITAWNSFVILIVWV